MGSRDTTLNLGAPPNPVLDLRAPIDLDPIPPTPAVVIFEDHSARTTLVATTADARAFTTRRLGDPDPAAQPSARADHRQITARVLIIPVASAFEAELVYLREARMRLPAEHRAIAERWRAWWVHTDPRADFPNWTKTNLVSELVPARRAGGRSSPRPASSQGIFLGPLPDKDAAGRLIEAIIDAADLCRFHNILVQAPRAAPCAYKEMGRCPAPCDGSETMDSYRARVHAAADLAAAPAGARAVQLEQRMREASAAHSFEEAQRLHKVLDRVRALDKPAFSRLSTLDSFRWLFILPAGKRAWARLYLCAGPRVLPIADVHSDCPADTLAPLSETIARAARDAGTSIDTPEDIETIGLVSRWLFAINRKKRAAAIPLRAGAPAPRELSREIRRITGEKTPEEAPDELELDSLGS